MDYEGNIENRNTITVETPAKINLYLDITGKREDGYHEIETVFQAVSLFDRITVTKTEEGITLISDDPELPLDETNLMFRAAALFYEITKNEGGVKIEIEKRIPMAAGLGGGSSDAAAVLYCLNALTGGFYENADLEKMAVKLGADVPFFFHGGTQSAGGIGEDLLPLPDLEDGVFLLVKSAFGMSTADVYAAYDDSANAPFHAHGKIVSAFLRSEEVTVKHIAPYMKNALEQPALSLRKELADLKRFLQGTGAERVILSGSGSTMVAVFADETFAREVEKKVKEKQKEVTTYLVKPEWFGVREV